MMAGSKFYVRSDKPYSVVYYNISLGRGNRLTGKTETKVRNPKTFNRLNHNIQELYDFDDWVEKKKGELKNDPDIKEKLYELIEEKFERSTNEYAKKKKIVLIDFFDEKIKDLKKKNKSKGTQSYYKYAQQYLIEFGAYKKIKFGVNYRHVTDDFLDDFNDWLIEIAKSKKGTKNISQGYANLMISCVCTVMTMALKKGQHSNGSFQAYEYPEVDSFAVYLTNNEVIKLRDLKLDSEVSQAINDYFFLLCRTGARVSDAMAWNQDNLYNQTGEQILNKNGQPIILYRATKTNKLHAVPITDEVDAILERWAILGRKAFPNERKKVRNTMSGLRHWIYKDKINNNIGSFLKLAGITYLVENKNDPNKIISKPKYEWVTSHTGKRTASSLAYIDGKSIQWIRENITLHSSDITTLNYIKCDDHLEQMMQERGDLKIV